MRFKNEALEKALAGLPISGDKGIAVVQEYAKNKYPHVKVSVSSNNWNFKNGDIVNSTTICHGSGIVEEFLIGTEAKLKMSNGSERQLFA